MQMLSSLKQQIAIIIAVSFLVSLGHAADLVVARRPNQVFGHTVPALIHAVARDATIAEAAITAAYQRVDDVNRLMSGYVPTSDVSRLNRQEPNQPLAVAPETLACLQGALLVAEQTRGAFDPTCRPLVTLWKNAARKERKLPTAEALSAARARVGYQLVALDATQRQVAFRRPQMQLDLGGVAKGYALDLAVEALRKRGAVGGLVDLGGDLRAFGANRGQPWRVGVQDPFNPQQLLMKLEVADRALATSGNYRQPLEIEGQRFSHIVDPRTGRPTKQAPSVTVVAGDGLTADAWATALSVLTVAEGRKLVEAHKQLEALWITGTPGNPKLTRSSGFDAFVISGP